MSSHLPSGARVDGAIVPAVPAASVMLLRDGAPFEVLMLRRSEGSSFVPNAWVFPGGTLDESDRAVAPDDELSIMKVCAHRELFEETAIWLGTIDDPAGTRDRLLSGSLSYSNLLASASADCQGLVLTSRWITPKGIPKRFDTFFFLGTAGRDDKAMVDGTEVVEARWISPVEALAANERKEMPMVLPTIRNLQALARFENVESLLAERRAARVEPIEPYMVEEDGRPRIVVPGESK